MTHLIQKLEENNISISLNGDDLELSFDQPQIDPALIEELKTHKQELIAFLKKYATNSRADDSAIKAIAPAESYALSDAQKRLWIVSQFDEKASAAYNMPSYLKLEEAYDISNLKKAVLAVIERHEILRTYFKEDAQKEIRQWITPIEEVDIDRIFNDQSHVEHSLKEALKYVDADSFKEFNLEESSLLRIHIYRIPNNQFVLYYNMHHIISDGWSMEVLTKDIMTYYQAFKSNTNPTLAQLPIQYKDYAAWQVAQQETESFKKSKDYWITQLAGNMPVLSLPTTKKRPQVMTYNGRSMSAFITPELTQELRNFSKANGGSLFMSLLAIWNIVFYRYTNQRDIVIGTGIAGRDHADLESQIGFYVNSLALRNQIDPEESFETIFNQIKTTTLTAYEHKTYPFDRVVEDLKLERDTSRNPIFDIILSLQNIGDRAERKMMQGIDLHEVADLGPCMSKFDMAISFEEMEDTLMLILTFRTDVYENSMIEKLLHHYKNVVAEVIKHPKKAIATLDYLSEKEQQKFSTAYNQTQVSYPTNQTLVSLFKEQCVKLPNEIALNAGKKYTYQELDEISNQLAHSLIKEYNVKPADLVAVQLDISEHLVITILAILKVGATYIPIDTNYPQERKEFILNETKLKLLVTDSNYIFDLDYYEGNLLAIDINFVADEHDKVQPNVECNASDLAYIIYTSGSTGTPKGVMITHGSIANYLQWSNDFYLNENLANYNFGLFTSIAFDLTLTSLFLPLISGGTLKIFESNSILDILEEYLNSAVSCIKLTPAHVNLLAELDIKTPTLEVAIVGGEELKPQQVSILKSINPSIKIYNEYGPTETTVGCIVQEIENENDPIYIGKPIANTDVYILDAHGKMVTEGVIGELYIGGLGVAKGYLNQAEITASKFIPHPFKNGEKIYRTGDFGRWLHDGTIDYVGRQDDQVKIMGYRIELAEIEIALLAQTSVKQVVVAVDTIKKQKSLVAYIISDEPMNDGQLRETLRESLPAYMVPNYYVQIDEMPLTKNGKIDKRALPKVQEEHTDRKIIAPRSTEEEVLVAVWKEVLEEETISVTDNFYDLGGDSIKSILIGSRLKRKGYTFTEDILSHPILEDLAKYLVANIENGDQKTIVGNVGITPTQLRFLENNVLASDHLQYVHLKAKETIKQETLEAAVHALTTHHDMLRTRFVQKNKEWFQVVEEVSTENYTIDFYEINDTEISQIIEEAKANFNLKNNPLCIVKHIRTSKEDHIILMSYKAIVDSVSWKIIVEDLANFYLQYQEKITIDFPLKTTSFKRWNTIVADTQTDEEYTFWNAKLRSTHVKLATQETINYNRHCSFTLDASATNLLTTKVNLPYHTTLQDVLLTGLNLVVSDTFDTKINVFNIIDDRRNFDKDAVVISRSVGCFSAIYPLVFTQETSSDIQQLIQTKEVLRNIPNGGYNFQSVAKKHPGLLENYQPLVSFNLAEELTIPLNEETIFSEYQSETSAITTIGVTENKAPLYVSGTIINGKLKISVAYDVASFNADTIENFTKNYEKKIQEFSTVLAHEKDTFITPSDLTFRKLSMNDLSEINKNNTVEDVYELSPLQELMYFQWVSDTSSSSNLEQLSFCLRFSNMDASILEKAYSELISRYTILRTSFTNKYADSLLQIVHSEASAKFAFKEKPSGISNEAYIGQIKSQQIKQGFDLREPSQMALTVVVLGNDEYEFIWNFHHILIDGWSTSVLINDFYILLTSLLQGENAILKTPPPYVDYIKWLVQKDKKESQKFWEDYLHGFAVKSKVPFELQPENKEVYHRKGIEIITIEGELFSEMNRVLRETKISQSLLIQAIWGFLLSKYNNTNDIVFGSVVSGRPSEVSDIERMVGLFINMIPVRLQYNNTEAIEDILIRFRDEGIRSRAHHHVNLSEIQYKHVLGADLINNVIVFQNFPKNILADINNSSENDEETFAVLSKNVHFQVDYDFLLGVVPTDEAMDISFVYNEERYSKALIEMITGHFMHVLQEFCTNIKKPLSTLDIVSKKERDTILEVFNDTKTEFPKDKTVVELFHEQAKTTPDSIAVVYESKELTYSELDKLSNAFAHYIKEKYAVQPDDFIGVKLEKSEWLLVVVLGIMKSGAAYVPINLEYPEDVLSFIEKDSNCKAYIDAEELAHFVANKTKYTTEFVTTNATADNLAYLMYTSGSTGTPKAVMVAHKSIVRLVKSTNYYAFSATDVILSTGAFSFDATTFEYWGALLNGGELVLCSQNVLLDSNLLAEEIQRRKVTTMWFTSGWLNQLVDSDINIFKGLQTILVGGDKLSPHHIQKLRTTYTDVQIINGYGPTENTTFSLTHNIKAVSGDIPIGTPISNSTAYILDENHELLPIGMTGEICLGGDGLARGYHNHPELTETKFVQNPFNTSSLLYKTGDLGKWHYDGTITFEGRNDDQVKIRGYRIELGEIEQKTTAITGVKQAAVVIRTINDNKTIVAYIVGEASLKKEHVRDILSKKLPDYMLPTYYMMLAELPLNTNGKVDRKNLPEINEAAIIKKEYIAPKTELEKTLVAIWKDVLELEEIGITDNFFKLGGHSIKAIKVIHKLSEELEVKINIKNIFTYPTIKSLAAQVALAKKQEEAIKSMVNLNEMEI
ncbi:Linear gramicidin synthase subunit D [Kordia antarctica]|uniref:Linear gramicidin synthase subunit D n=1 Tax=Kordia antarctica TaxID=1218801 RepID=A0A7L4ZGM5_9FLAO|nr:non-ribosomal peptide synthetase [Kordia antarctica]QHI35406.1 Linear gramicidin synthase subunit D [Kordia antarctica]